MGIDRREFLIGAARSAALLAMPWDRARAAHDMELFAAARRDDRGSYSAALFSLEGGDVRSVELPSAAMTSRCAPARTNGSPLPAGPDGSGPVTVRR